MKKNLKRGELTKLKLVERWSATFTLAAFILFNSSFKVFAADKKVENSNNGQITREINADQISKTELNNEVATDNNRPLGPSIAPARARNNKIYTFDELNRMNYSDLVELIKTISYENVPDLFNFNDGSYTFFSNRDRVQAIIYGLEDSGRTYTADDDKGIPTLVEFLRAGYYLGFYNKQLSYLNTPQLKNECLPAMKAIQYNSNFRLGTKAQDGVVEALGRLIGNASADPEVINNCIYVLSDFKDNIDKYGSNYSKGNAVFNLMKGMDYYTNSVIYNTKGYDAKNTEFYNRIDPYMERLESLCTIGDKLNNDNAWLVNNALYYTGRMGKFREDPSISQRALERAMKEYPYLSYQYIEAANDLDLNFGGKNSSGNDIDFNKIKADAREKYLPKTYTFDDGKFVVKAGDKVTEEKIKRLYWASKEVKAQFMRVVQNDKALEEGNPDDILTVVIYNSPEEYKLNRIINGFSTDNGGIYIENIGTFFTYERTPEESIYTLEELFRHEFTHYLQGRYVVPGMWGQGEFYQEGVLTWYEEGTAEFFAGSTRTDGIKPRKSVTQGLAYDRNNRMSLYDVLHAKYGSWDFYNYGFALSNYMYNNNIGMFNKMTNYIKNNDVSGYKDYIASMSSDYGLNDKYQDYIDSLLNNIDNLDVPLVSDEYVNGHEAKDINEITNDIKEVSNIKDLSSNVEKSQFFTTYDMRGTYVGGRSQGEENDWKDMNSKLNDILKELSKKSWNGYKTVTAYFVNHKVDENGNYVYDVVFHGMNTDTNTDVHVNKEPKAVIKSDSSVIVGEEINFDGTESKDEDGEIKAYEWDFGDGEKSNEAKAAHKYNKTGEYEVKLTVTDNNGGINIESKKIKVVEDKPVEVINESEPNNDFEKANQITKSNMLVKGTLSQNDYSDKYYFDVVKKGNVKITLNNLNSVGITWTLYKEGDLNNYVLYATRNDGTELKGEKILEPGRYYLSVYTYDNQSGAYTVNVKGNLKNEVKATEKDAIKEVENNNDFDKAMKVDSNSKIVGTLSNDDLKDIYSIDIQNPSDLNIVVENLDNIKMNWLLYSADDLSNYVDYANADGNKLSNTCKLNPGKYYLCVYQFENSGTGNYTVNLQNK